MGYGLLGKQEAVRTAKMRRARRGLRDEAGGGGKRLDSGDGICQDEVVKLKLAHL